MDFMCNNATERRTLQHKVTSYQHTISLVRSLSISSQMKCHIKWMKKCVKNGIGVSVRFGIFSYLRVSDGVSEWITVCVRVCVGVVFASKSNCWYNIMLFIERFNADWLTIPRIDNRHTGACVRCWFLLRLNSSSARLITFFWYPSVIRFFTFPCFSSKKKTFRLEKQNRINLQQQKKFGKINMFYSVIRSVFVFFSSIDFNGSN